MNVPLDVIEPCGFPFSVKSLRRAAMDYADIVDMTAHDSWESFLNVRPNGRLVLLTTGSTEDFWDFEFEPTDTLVLGRESAGVPQSVHEICDARITIPIQENTRSLNVAVSAAMVLSEGLRQTRLPKT